jgi:hypothetical protein
MGKLGQWLQVAANLGILVGLVLVAIQINQASQLTQSQLVSDQYAVRIANMDTMLGENPAPVIAKGVLNPEEMADSDMIVMDSWMIREMLYARRVLRLIESGVYPLSAWEQQKEALDYAFSSKFAREWWRLNRVQYQISDPTLTSAIDKEISDAETNNDWRPYLERLRKAVSE